MSLEIRTDDTERRARRLHSALDHLPRSLRFALIASAIIEDVPGAVAACSALATLAATMAAQLNEQQRLAVARHMFQEARSLLVDADGGPLH
jgi:hypothetical protein